MRPLFKTLLITSVFALACVLGQSTLDTSMADASPCGGDDTDCDPGRMKALYNSPDKPMSVTRVRFGKGGISARVRGESQGWENSYLLRLGKGQRLHIKHHKRDCVGLEIRAPSGKALYRATSNSDIKLELPEKGDYTIHTIGYMGAHGRNYYDFTITVI